MMGRSISLKLVFLFTISMLSTVFMSFFIHFTFFEHYYVYQMEKRFLSIYEDVSKGFGDEDFQSLLSAIDRREQVGIVVADSRLRSAIYSHPMAGEGGGQPLERELHSLLNDELEYLRSGEEYICSFIQGDEGPDRLVFAKRLPSGDFCILTNATGVIEGSMEVTSNFHLVAGGIAALVGLMFVLIFSKQVTRPIIAMSEVTEGLSQLDFQQKVDVESRDELGQLGQSINILSQRLEEHREALKKEIAFQKVLSQNMSHELKTPISVMKGYLEALSYGVASTKEEEEEYFQVIIEECDRMTQVIDMMLHLSKLTTFQENGIEKEYFSAQEFQERVLGQSRNLLLQHQVASRSLCEDVEIYGNEDLLLQAYGNFVTNAVKYGDHKVIISSITTVGEMLVLKLYNSGLQLSQAECEKVFDVFYMVDKVRGREANSHGLGLSVTKTIAELHGGEVGCEPEEEGMSFFLKIPRG